MKKIKYLLLQARKENDPMIQNELDCFINKLQCDKRNIKNIDVIRDNINKQLIAKYDVVLIGGSGDFSIAKGGEWMSKVMDIMSHLYEVSKVTFASCWGFQAMAAAKGGKVVNDLKRAELGTTKIKLTEDGKKDVIFKNLPNTFMAQMGHEDIVDRLPNNSILLASSKKVKNEAFKFKKKPIYCTQFHPELNKSDLQKRMRTYPNYVTKILGINQNEFLRNYCYESKDTETLIHNFIKTYVKLDDF